MDRCPVSRTSNTNITAEELFVRLARCCQCVNQKAASIRIIEDNVIVANAEESDLQRHLRGLNGAFPNWICCSFVVGLAHPRQFVPKTFDRFEIKFANLARECRDRAKQDRQYEGN